VLPSFEWADLLQVHLDEDEGGILVFLTGQEEIELVKQTLVEIGSTIIHPRKLQLVSVAVYAALPAEEQTAAFAQLPKGTRKVVLATNIAETSVTIPGIRFVVDSGMVKSRAYNAAKGMESLQVCTAILPLAFHISLLLLRVSWWKVLITAAKVPRSISLCCCIIPRSAFASLMI
jgi:hypothetical protein